MPLLKEFHIDGRRQKRHGLFGWASVEQDGKTVRAVLRDLSIGGAKLEGPNLPRSGHVVITHGRRRIEGTIAWCARGRRGVCFDRAIDPAEWLNGGVNPDLGAIDCDPVLDSAQSDMRAALDMIVEQRSESIPDKQKRIAKLVGKLEQTLANLTAHKR